jgi:hypothetical protein
MQSDRIFLAARLPTEEIHSILLCHRFAKWLKLALMEGIGEEALLASNPHIPNTT